MNSGSMIIHAPFYQNNFMENIVDFLKNFIIMKKSFDKSGFIYYSICGFGHNVV